MSHLCGYCGKDIPEANRGPFVSMPEAAGAMIPPSMMGEAQQAQPAGEAKPFAGPVFTVGDMERAVKAARNHERQEAEQRTAEAIDSDRIASFMQFARALPPNHQGIITGTSNQVRSIARALEKAGY